MADNVIRHDIVKLSYEVEGIKEIQKLQNELNDLKKKFTGGLGDDAFEDLQKNANKSVKPLKNVKEQAEKVTKSLKDIAKKGATAAFNGLKKLAGISFKALAGGITAAAVATGALVSQAVTAYADFEQLKGGVETLFGAQGAKTVEEYAQLTGKTVNEVKDKYNSLIQAQTDVFKNANDAYKTAGLSANEYMTTVTGFSASLVSSLGGDTVKAAELANQALIDMSDNANKMGTPMGNIQNAYQAFAKQNYTLLDNLKLGYGGTKTEMERLLKDAQKLTGVKYNISSYADIIEAIHAIQNNMGITGTTAKEAATTITGSLNATKAAWGNLLTAISSGENLDQCIDNMVDSVETFAKNVIPVAEKALGGIGKLVEKLAPIISEKLPPLIQKLLPPLIKAAVELTKGLIKALPSIIKTLAVAIVDIFGEQFPIIAKIGNFFKENSAKIANGIKAIIPVVIALAAAFKGFNAVKSITSLFGGKGGAGGKDGEKGGAFGGITNIFKDLAKAKTTTILKGMANLAIILGGFAAMTAVLLAVAPLITKIGGFSELLKLAATMLVLGVVGVALAKFGDIAGKINITTTLKGLANMAIMLAGMSALFLLVGAISLINFDLKRVLGITLIIGALGTIGFALTLFAAIAGLIPIPVVLLGLANMAIVIAGMSALFLLIGATSLLNFDLKRITAIIGIITLLGTVGAALSVFAGIVGVIPIPVVLAGLANIGLVLGGMTALIVAFGELTRIEGFTEFLEKGGKVLVQIMNILGEMVGALAGGFVEGLASCLPALGESLGKFGENIAPLFTAMSGIDMAGVGAFFTALVGLLAVATGKDIIDGIKEFFGGGGESPLVKLGTDLTNFATNASGFFATIAKVPADTFPKATELFKSLAEIKNLPKADKSGKTAISAIANDLSTFGEKTSGFFEAVKNFDLEKTNQLWETLKNADGITKNLSTVVNDNLDAIVTKVGSLPQRMAEAFRQAGSSLSAAFAEVWEAAVRATVAPANKLIASANHIFREFGSNKRIAQWQPYAKGTNGHKGGNALVNDGRGAELIQMPNGRMFIPNGRNVFLPNAPKGMKVLPAELTAWLMGRNSPSFSYANGTGAVEMPRHTISYTPESDSRYYSTNKVEHNTYAPQFNVTISGTSDDRTMYRKIKRMIAEAWSDIVDDLDARTPQTQQV